jgi:putative oxidoreductase
MKKLRKTNNNRSLGRMRIMLGITFLMTGIMKLALSEFGTAWSMQLTEAKIPFYEFTFWFVPILEFCLGIVLLLGFYSRIGAVMVLPIMLVAIYVHLTINNPAAFPAQPQEPIVPIIVIIMALAIVKKGGGNWSLDLRSLKGTK